MKAFAFAIVLNLFLVTGSFAATFLPGGDKELNCFMTVKGVIDTGDAERFRSFLRNRLRDILAEIPEDDRWHHLMDQDRGAYRICLDSPGGSYSEAIEMADTLLFGYMMLVDSPEITTDRTYWPYKAFVRLLGTAVASGARCESACAVFFMSGGFFHEVVGVENARDPDRVLHVNGRLGFHAPGLTVSSGNYNKASVSRAFSLAIASINELNVRSRTMYFSPSLFAKMLSTPPEEMFYIDTVSQAYSWGIQLHGAPVIDQPTQVAVDRACRSRTLHSHVGWGWDEMYGGVMPERVRENGVAFYGGGGTIIGRFYEISDLQDIEDIKNSKTTSEALIGTFECNSKFRDSGQTTSGSDQVGDDFRWIFYPSYTTLEYLLSLSRTFGGGLVPGETMMEPIEDSYEAVCAKFVSREISALAPCSFKIVSRESADGLIIEVQEHVVWPDGTLMIQDVVKRPHSDIRLRQKGWLETMTIGDRGWTAVGQWDVGITEDFLANPPSLLKTFDLHSETKEGWSVADSKRLCLRKQSDVSVYCFSAIGDPATNIPYHHR